MNKLKEIWFIYKNKIIVSLMLSIISITLFAGIYFFNVQKANADSIEFQSNSDLYEEKDIKNTIEVSDSSMKKVVKVDIKGEIKNPGLYQLEVGQRVNDVIKLAGGLTNNADTSVTNLSKILSDEMVIIIYSKKQVESFTDTKKNEILKSSKCKNNEKLVNDSCVSPDDTSSKAKNSSNSSLININTASIDELMSLSGIGESKAQAIIEYRTKNGKFSTINDILNVSGIGQSIFDKIKSNITV